MKNFMTRTISLLLAVILVVSGIPVTALAKTIDTLNNSYVTEINDGYVSVSVSNQNGGFLIDTLLGNQLKGSDDNKNLLFPSEGYDTSFTSIRVTRTDGSVEEYVFGRKYGFLGLASTDVKVEAAGSSITATWGVKDLTVVQTLTLVDEVNSQHGLVSIDYDVTTTADNVENIKLRILMDTALGDQDYGFYELYNSSGSYNLVHKECLVENAYDNVLRSITGEGASSVNAYTVNAIVDGVEIKPYQVAFGHWANLATTLFDFIPDNERPAFNNPLDAQYLTADSAYALYYDLGSIAKDESAIVSTYYGVFSNSTVSEEESVALNFIQVPSSMKIKDDSSLESASYYSQVDGGADGDVEVKLLIENVSASSLEDLYVVVKTMNNVLTYTGNYPTDKTTTDGTHTIRYSDVHPGDELSVTLNFNVSPKDVGEYRYFEVEVYSDSMMSESNLLGSNGFYLLCPSVLGEEVSFNTTKPQTIYTQGTRTLYVSGENFGLLRDTSAYTAYLKPVDGEVRTRGVRSNLPTSIVIPSKNIVVNSGANTMNVSVDSELAPGKYQLILDWNEEGKEDTTSIMLIVEVSDDEAYMNPTYGVVTIEKTLDFSNDDPKYQLTAYRSKEVYEQYWEQLKAQDKSHDADQLVLLEFYGNFSLTYDADGNLVKATAQSVESADGFVSGTINISNCLDVEGGYVTITVDNVGQDDQVIKTDIDGHVYTSGERTTVWNGVCALTSIANGEINSLTPYRRDGSEDNTIEGTVHIANTIKLLWPAVAGTFQEMMGIFFEMRYCEFGIMAMEHTDEGYSIFDDRYADVKKTRVIAFSAYMDPGGLIPNSYDWKGRNTSAADVAMLHLARSNYTPDQLREVSAGYKNDLKNWMTADTGELCIVIENILFGDNRFIGFEVDTSIALPSYFAGMPGIEGALHFALWLLEPDDDFYYEMGVNGTISVAKFFVEAALTIKSINGFPVPDELYLYVGGFSPGLNIDGCGVVWITGAGGGFSKLYETIMNGPTVPAFTVTLEGGFSLFQILYARLQLDLSARGIGFLVKNVGFNPDTSNMYTGSTTDEILTIFPELGASIYWYPKFKASAHYQVNVLDIVDGGGYIILEQNTQTDKMFFEALATCTVHTPDIPIIGRITLGGVDVGVDLTRLYGVLHITKLDLGLCYYYGEGVDFSFGKYEVPSATLLSQKVGQLEDGTDVYLAFGTNVSQVASSTDSNVMLSASPLLLGSANPTITSAMDRMSHSFTLGAYSNGDIALTVNYNADSLEEAQAIAMGNWLTKGLTVTDSKGNPYELQWLDTSKVLTEEVADNANALLNYNKETGEASVTITFTEAQDFAEVWSLTSSVPCELVMYNVTRLANMETVDYTVSGDKLTVTCNGSLLKEMDSFSVSAVDSEGVVYHLGLVEEFEVEDDGSVILTMDVPAYLPTGSYTIDVNARAEESNVNDTESAANVWNHTNPNQPAAPTIFNTALGGDYRVAVDVSSNGTVAYDGYAASVYVWDETSNTWTTTEYSDYTFEADQTRLTMGGSYSSTVWLDAEGKEMTYSEYLELSDAQRESVTTATKKIGLEAGKKYRMGVVAYKIVGENYLCSEEVFSQEITMVAPNPATITVTGEDVRKVEKEDPYDRTQTIIEETYTNNQVTLNLVSDQNATIIWELDNGIQSGEVTLTAGQTYALTLTGNPDKDYCEIGGLSEGSHLLEIFTINENGDESSLMYAFTVDTVAPKIMLSGPDNGSFFGETVTVSGISEANAQVHIELDGTICATANTDSSGYFSAEVVMDTSVYEQTLTVYAVDPAGNASREYNLVLTNELIGDLDAELAIYFNGQDVTGETIPADADGYLELRYVVGDRYVTVPYNSSQGTAVYWDVYAVQGTGSVTTEGGFYLETSADINGMLSVFVDKIQVSAVLGGNVLAQNKLYTVTLPVDPVGYSVATNDPTTVAYDGSFSFTVAIAEGYEAAQLVVCANGVELTPDPDGVYTIENIRSNKTVTVSGVVGAEAPDITITVKDHFWNSFLNTITFGLFFKETQQVTIEAADAGSGVANLYYHISNTALTEQQVQALGDDAWTVYTDAISLEPTNTYVVYAKAMDNSFMISYASSDGMVIKNTAPVISGVENGCTYYGDQTVTISDEYLDSVTLDGVEVSLTDNNFVIPADNAQHTIVATDKAGNSVTVTMTIYKIYTITFMANNQVVATKQVGHGQSLDAQQFPEIPTKEGYDQVAPVWNPAEVTNVSGDMTVVAIYTRNIYQVILPQEQNGYTIRADMETVLHGDSITFTVEVAEGYDSENMVVTVNGVAIEPVDGVYTFDGVRSDVKIAVSGVVDITPPDAKIEIDTNSWHEFLNTITFGLFFNDTLEAVITASDTGSGIKELYYLDSAEAMTLDQLQTGQWTAYTMPVRLSTDSTYVVYAKAVDNASNVTYISSDGMVIDTVAPLIQGIENGGVYYGTTTFAVSDDYIALITVGAETVYDASTDAPVVSRQVTLNPAEGAQEIVITDKAGNVTTYTVTVYPIHTVTYVADGEVVDTQTVKHGKDAVAPEVPAKDGYTGAWDHDGKNITADTTITAVYQAIPDSDTPQTGDTSQIMLYAALALLVLCAIIVLILNRGKFFCKGQYQK